MDTVDALFEGLALLLSVRVFLYMLVGIALGLILGLLPGLGGPVGLALVLPFTFDMGPAEAFALMLSMLAVTSVTGDMTSILIGVPGETSSAALVVDGYPMTKKGESGRALGASLAANLMGAVFGAVVLAASIPLVRPLVLSLGSPEFFMLTILGLSFVATLSAGSVLKGLVAAAGGMLFATVGLDPQTGIQRYTAGQLELWDGIGLVSVALGLFAIPELLSLSARKFLVATPDVSNVTNMRQGVRDTLRHWFLTLRCSGIGTLIGILPGMGGAVAQWIAYGHAVQSSPDKERFGKGAIEGVIGPGAANNSKEGGSLLPTVAFGIPASVTYAILLGGFLIQGLQPGPSMLTTQLPLTMSFVWVIVLSNVIAIAICLPLVKPLARLSTVRASILLPILITLVYIGAYADGRAVVNVGVMLLFGFIGVVMMALGWPRPPLMLGVVLGSLTELYLFRSVSRFGLDWLTRPGVLLILACSLVVIVGGIVYELRSATRRAQERGAERSHESEQRRTS